MTPDSETSKWVKRELHLADHCEKQLFPLLLAGANWDLFVLTKYLDVRDESLPGDDFLDQLGRYAPRKSQSGTNVTQVSQSPIVLTIQDKDKEPSLIDITKDSFLAAMDRHDWHAAQSWLAELRELLDWSTEPRDLKRTPRKSELIEYEHELQTEMRRSEIEVRRLREYNRLKTMVRFGDPSRARTALQEFRASYGSYDPDGLADNLSPESVILSETSQRLLYRMRDPNLSPLDRLDAGNELASLGDSRRGVGLRPDGLPDIEWSEVPEGEFIYQKGDFAFQIGERVRLPTFYVARYPITHLQFQTFIDADDGFHNDQWWHGLAYRSPEPGKQRWVVANYPRENVNWFDAVAFCRWLSHKMGFDCEIRLPTEQEWEKAAQGTDGRDYPWGNKYVSGYANLNELRLNDGPYYLEQSNPVGMYPQGASPYGVLDTVGNVLEWCVNVFQAPENNSLKGSGERVLRGSSWNFSAEESKTRDRHRGNPFERISSQGLRVVCGPPLRE
jgi:formylglycine-generating enzyme required for sulfatase activity